MVDLTAKIVKLENDIEDFKRRERELPAEEKEQRLAFLGVVKESTKLLNTLITQQGTGISSPSLYLSHIKVPLDPFSGGRPNFYPHFPLGTYPFYLSNRFLKVLLSRNVSHNMCRNRFSLRFLQLTPTAHKQSHLHKRPQVCGG